MSPEDELVKKYNSVYENWKSNLDTLLDS
jgi:hypothetical protein